MGSGVRAGAAVARSGWPRADFGNFSGSPSIDPSDSSGPWAAANSDGDERQFPEIDCIRRLVPADVLKAAERRAAAVGVGADRVLIAADALDEETYLRALGETLGVAFEPLDGVPRAQCPLDDVRLIESAAAGLLSITIDNGLAVVVAPRGLAARRILQLIEDNPAQASRFRFTSAERFSRFVLRHTGELIANRASYTLKRTWPKLSAASPRWSGNILSVASIGMLSLAAVVFAPDATVLAFELTLATVFLAWLALRLTGAFINRPPPGAAFDLSDAALPVYTVVAALYREAASVDGLLSAIERLDYPAEKLDVIVAVETDDRETRAALASRKTRMPITVIPVAAIGPRTKPKALNVALPFARGTFTVVYDAEDRPDRNQLRCALQAFRAAGDDLACVQARLSIDNTADSWLAGFYTAEYAGQFDVFLPGLAALRLPLPLGGSSNHFYTATLREVGGWDPHNVTEDADLGMRLTRFGYRSDIIDSTTYEEAPATIHPWLRQRTRWFKGWMQTWLVHMRQPRLLFRDIGLPGFVAFQLMVGGNVLAALIHPLFMAGLVYSIVNGAEIWRGGTANVGALGALYGITAIIGYLASAFLGWLGLDRRGLLATAWVLMMTPVHWLLLSYAAWRALYHLAVAPYDWEKTEHGLAKSSRRSDNMTRALLELERHLTKLKDDGQLPEIADGSKKIFRSSAAAASNFRLRLNGEAAVLVTNAGAAVPAARPRPSQPRLPSGTR